MSTPYGELFCGTDSILAAGSVTLAPVLEPVADLNQREAGVESQLSLVVRRRVVTTLVVPALEQRT